MGLDMSAAIRTIHRSGLEIIGSFVLGLDGDDRTTFAKTLDFARRHKLAAAQFSVLTPFPGTVMREQLEAEGRILDHDWSHYTMSNVVFRPLHMTPEELHQGQREVYDGFYSLPSIFTAVVDHARPRAHPPPRQSQLPRPQPRRRHRPRHPRPTVSQDACASAKRPRSLPSPVARVLVRQRRTKPSTHPRQDQPSHPEPL